MELLKGRFYGRMAKRKQLGIESNSLSDQLYKEWDDNLKTKLRNKSEEWRMNMVPWQSAQGGAKDTPMRS